MEIQLVPPPVSVCWDITNRCNDKCQFCYRIKELKELNIGNNMLVLDRLIAGGVKKITWVGGEPLLYKGLFKLIKKAKDYSIVTSLTTNGILLSDRILRDYDLLLDWITVPLDGGDSKVQTESTRNKHHFDNVVNILEYMKRNNLRYKVKINTVVTKNNIKNVPDIIEIVKKYKINRWKIFQFFPVRGDSLVNKKKFEVDKKAYIDLKNTIHKLTSISSVTKIQFEDNNAMMGSYFSISPNADVRVSTAYGDVTLGNLLDNSVEQLWSSKEVNPIKHLLRCEWLLN